MHFLREANSGESEPKMTRKARSTTDVTFLIFMTFFYIVLVRYLFCIANVVLAMYGFRLVLLDTVCIMATCTGF